jgi:hypothetical protein
VSIPKTYEWTFAEDNLGTELFLVSDGNAHDLGHYVGRCYELDGPPPHLSDGEIIGVRCKSGDTADEIGVFASSLEHPGELLIKHARLVASSSAYPSFEDFFVYAASSRSWIKVPGPLDTGDF